jgi:hypothetical protein
MKNLYILTLFSLMLYANQSNAQWKSLNAPKSNNEDYQLLAVSDNGKNFAACTGKFDLTTFKTTLTYTTSHDFGATWQVYPTNQIQGGQSIFWDGDVLYVQTSNATIADLKNRMILVQLLLSKTTHTTHKPQLSDRPVVNGFLKTVRY